jgi:glyoxylase-like metal-dependent hydrolase (beta-lactamase superfamily II)
VLDLTYHGTAHEPGNIFIHAPAQRVLMVVDVVFPGWMPWRRFGEAQDIPGYLAQVEQIGRMDWDVLVGGHVGRTGTHADVALQVAFNRDVRAAAAAALADAAREAGPHAPDRENPWAAFDAYADRVAARCVAALTPRWAHRLAAFDVHVRDQCDAMEHSLRID